MLFGVITTLKKMMRQTDEYGRLRGNMPTIEVVPSLKPNQEFEARMKIVPHTGLVEKPLRVIWCAGEKFSVVTCEQANNSDFRSTFSYYKPMLVQVTMVFGDGSEEHAYVYAHMRE